MKFRQSLILSTSIIWKANSLSIRIPAQSFGPRTPPGRSVKPMFLNNEASGSLEATTTSSAKEKEKDDSLEQFSMDIEHVIHELRGSPVDPTIPKLFRNEKRLSYANTWTLEDWERHYSRKRYLRYLVNFPRSRLLQRIAPQMTVLTLWTLFSLWIENHLPIAGLIMKEKSTIPLTSLGIISSFVAFLLTMRSNMGLSRLDEGRKLWSKVVLHSREMAHLISAFIYPHDKQIALKLGRHVACFGWLLKSQLRFVSEEDIADIVNTMVPDKADADYILQHRQKPLAVVMRVRQAIHYLGRQGKLTTAEEIALDHTAHNLSEVVTSTGRIRASPIPVLYTSHTTRLLTFYLCFLPTALRWNGLDGVATMISTWAVGFAMLGLDELSHLCEQPFRLMPMYQISKRSMVAVADAFTCRPPPLEGEERDDERRHLSQKQLTSYWNSNDAMKLSDDTME